jgi:hypothetical protein
VNDAAITSARMFVRVRQDSKRVSQNVSAVNTKPPSHEPRKLSATALSLAMIVLRTQLVSGKCGWVMGFASP